MLLLFFNKKVLFKQILDNRWRVADFRFQIQDYIVIEIIVIFLFLLKLPLLLKLLLILRIKQLIISTHN